MVCAGVQTQRAVSDRRACARPPGALAHFPVAASHRAALLLEAAVCLTTVKHPRPGLHLSHAGPAESSRPFPPRLTRRRGAGSGRPTPVTAYRRYDQARPRDPTHRAPGRDPSRGSPAQTLRQTDRSGAAGGGGRAASWVLGVTCTKYCETHRAVSVPYPVSALRLWTSASSLMVRYQPVSSPKEYVRYCLAISRIITTRCVRLLMSDVIYPFDPGVASLANAREPRRSGTRNVTYWFASLSSLSFTFDLAASVRAEPSRRRREGATIRLRAGPRAAGTVNGREGHVDGNDSISTVHPHASDEGHCRRHCRRVVLLAVV